MKQLMESTIKLRDDNNFKKYLAFQNYRHLSLFFYIFIYLFKDERNHLFGNDKADEKLTCSFIGHQNGAQQIQSRLFIVFKRNRLH